MPRRRHVDRDEPHACGARQRRRRARARLRRHVLRVARASERAARAGDRSPPASSRMRDAAHAARRVRRRLRDRRPARRRDEPAALHQRGWHCTSTLGTIGAAAAVAACSGSTPHATRHALGIAASAASGLKENFGTMVKPLHAGLAARNGVIAALLARRGLTASAHAIDGPQGYLAAMDSEQPIARRRSRRSRHALGDPRHRHHREAVSVMRRHASAARRVDRDRATRTVHAR